MPGINLTHELSNGQTLVRKHGNRAPVFDTGGHHQFSRHAPCSHHDLLSLTFSFSIKDPCCCQWPSFWRGYRRDLVCYPEHKDGDSEDFRSVSYFSFNRVMKCNLLGSFGNHRSRWCVPTLNRGKVFQVSGPIVAFASGGWAKDATLSAYLCQPSFVVFLIHLVQV